MENVKLGTGLEFADNLVALHDRLRNHRHTGVNVFKAFPGDELKPVFDKLMERASRMGIDVQPMTMRDYMRKDANAYYIPVLQRIHLPLEREKFAFMTGYMPSYNAMSVLLAHELGHVVSLPILWQAAGNQPGMALSNTPKEETVAESISHLIMGVHGLDTSFHTCDYLSMWGREVSMSVIEGYGPLIMAGTSFLLR